ncbi:alpha/beta hydrolase fold-3 domain-containing protein [Gordonia polyisoprenivorans VH2]|uniref:Alpha/beta hydrolase fold-3 domain-containing protein n=1 Tax=Gordonia polyisoprenivorans (strain DSM 44266 / VH2) TaxID=1112204 RepID=H6MSC2_GORPV|nr:MULTISPECIES: alpha/beta hydrolase [Gordonia]AFA71380.1 alpha/beta hydrolase fold-3 domain-containing protein [Gordonia polyisoprenivorans VH2]OPX17241.1 alpha/beta hydrolase [Gordonia sp. i37]
MNTVAPDLSDPAAPPHPDTHVGPGSRRSHALNSYLSRVSRPLMAATRYGPSPVAVRMLRATRPGVNRSLAAMCPVPAGTAVLPIATRHGDGQVRGEWVGTVDTHGPGLTRGRDRPIIYYLHGSGYVVCSPRTHRGLVARLSRQTGFLAFSLDYRLGPEYRWPTGGDDTIRGYHWLLDQGIDADRIVVAGDSAGGHLALDLLADNHRTGTPQPSAMVLFSPLYDPSFATAVAHERAGARDPIIDAVAAQKILRLYTGDADPDHPRMRIPLDDGITLPRTLIQYGGLEVMGQDARDYHQALVRAGGDAQIEAWRGQGHVFQMFGRLTPDARPAVRRATAFLTESVTAH